jgi:arylsulfatase A-like enzyme
MIMARPTPVTGCLKAAACAAILAMMPLAGGCGERDVSRPSASGNAPVRAAQAVPGPQRPAEGPVHDRCNLVLVIIDTLRSDVLGCYGFGLGTSPELDALAQQGVRFSHVVAQCSWTRPSIASMLTSRYPRSLGLYKEKDEILNDSFVTLAEVLQSQGYLTFGITANPVINSVFNMHQGFDTHIDSNIIFSWMRPEAGKVTAREHRLLSSKEIFDIVLSKVDPNPPSPNYLQITIMEMHEYWRVKYGLTRPEFQQLFPDSPIKRYLQALRQVSTDIDAFVKALTALPGWGNTLFVFTSDHGQGLNNHPAVPNSGAHGRLLYESQVMVPLIFYHSKGGLNPQTIDRRVRLLDLMPTILDFLDAPPPGGMDGVSLMPLLETPEGPVDLPDMFVTETEFRTFNKIAVYAPEWKYIENRDGHPNLNPRELQPVGIKENGIKTDQIDKQPQVAAALQELLKTWEQRYPKVPATPRTKDLSETEVEQLQAIGYLQ